MAVFNIYNDLKLQLENQTREAGLDLLAFMDLMGFIVLEYPPYTSN
jgi:hypothetical protein